MLSANSYSQKFFIEKDSIANTVLMLSKDSIINGKIQNLVGTGTFFADIKNEKERLFIVTAGHVAKLMDEKSHIIIKGKNDLPLKYQITSFVKGNVVNWKYHNDADVSILELNITKDIEESNIMNNRFLPVSILYDSLKSLSRETILTTVGFPLGLGSEGYFSPLTFRTFASSGLITLPRFDNKIKSTFILLENPVAGGYSGGPVFDLGIIETGTLTMRSSKGTICYGITHGTISDGTGGKIGAITPSFFVLELINKHN